MNNNFQPTIVEAVQALYDQNSHAKQLFDWTASLQRDAMATTINRISQVLKIPYKAAVSLAKQLDDAGCGEFIVGRRGSPSRFEWAYSRVSLGQVAAGEAEEIKEVSDPISEKDEEAWGAEGSVQPLTISSAKILLAKSLELTPDQIEIQIRA